MSKQTCEIDGKIYEAAPCRYKGQCDGCAGDWHFAVCSQLPDCLARDIIWVEVE